MATITGTARGIDEAGTVDVVEVPQGVRSIVPVAFREADGTFSDISTWQFQTFGETATAVLTAGEDAAGNLEYTVAGLFLDSTQKTFGLPTASPSALQQGIVNLIVPANFWPSNLPYARPGGRSEFVVVALVATKGAFGNADQEAKRILVVPRRVPSDPLQGR